MKVIYTDKAPNSELYKQKRYGKLYTHHIAVFLFTYIFYIKPYALPISFISFSVKLVTLAIICMDIFSLSI